MNDKIVRLKDPVYAGTLVTVVCEWKDRYGVLGDPDSVEIDYASSPGVTTVTLTYGVASQITKIGVGQYEVALDTTGLPGEWIVEGVSTGDLQVVNAVGFTVKARNL